VGFCCSCGDPLEALWPATLAAGNGRAPSATRPESRSCSRSRASGGGGAAQPRNPIGWLLWRRHRLGAGNYSPAYVDSTICVITSLPLGHVALLFTSLTSRAADPAPDHRLFPDGHVGRRCAGCLAPTSSSASRRRWSLACDRRPAAAHPGRRLRLGDRATIRTAQAWASGPRLGLLALFALSAAAAVHQIRVYRRAGGERRQQLKWLASGAAIAAVSLPPSSGQTRRRRQRLFPLASRRSDHDRHGILRYRLYEIDRLVSRTLTYAILTALLVGTSSAWSR